MILRSDFCRLIAVAGAGFLCACAWGDGTGPEAPALSVSKAPASGDGQTGSISSTLLNPIEVEVTAGGAPVAGVSVEWVAMDPGASVTPGSALTGVDGIAKGTWTLGTAPGTQTVTATVAGAVGSPLLFTATAVGGPIPLLAKSASNSGDGQTGIAGQPLASPLRVRLTLDGVAQGGVTVTWASTSPGASMVPASSLTDASGIATSTWTLGGTTGTQLATAAVNGAAGSPVTFTATASAPQAADTVLVLNNQYTPRTLTVARGSTVVWYWPPNSRKHNVVPVPPATVPNSPVVVDGPYSYAFTFTTPGTYRYYCTVHGTANGGGMFATLVVQ